MPRSVGEIWAAISRPTANGAELPANVNSLEAGRDFLTAFLSQDCEAEGCNWSPVRAACETSHQGRNPMSVAKLPSSCYKAPWQLTLAFPTIPASVKERAGVWSHYWSRSSKDMRQGCLTGWLNLSDTTFVDAPCCK